MIKPIDDRVVLKVHEAKEITSSGIYVPNTESPNQATVVAVGPGRITEHGGVIPLAVSEGDTVIFSQFAGTKVSVKDEQYLIVHEADILAII